MLAAIAAIAGFYLLGIAGARTAGGGFIRAASPRWFVHSLVPIAFVYVDRALPDVPALPGPGSVLAGLRSARPWLGPLRHGRRSDRLRAHRRRPRPGTCRSRSSSAAMGALGLAHDRALELYADPRRALRSQYWMLVIMIGFTSLALWLLSQANA